MSRVAAVATTVAVAVLMAPSAGAVNPARTEHGDRLRVVSSTVEKQGCGQVLLPHCEGFTYVGANGFRVSSRTYLSMGMWTLFSLRPSLLGAQVTAREVVDSDRLPFWPEVTVHDTTEDCLYSTGNGTSPHAAGRLRVFVTVGADEPVLVADEFAEGCAGRSAHVDLRALADVTEPVRLRIVREVWLRAEAVTLRGRASYWREATLSVTAG